MNTDDRRILAKALGIAAEVYERQISADLMRIWEALIDEDGLDATAVSAAIKQHIKTSKFFPRPAEIRELLIPRRDTHSEALLSWTTVLSSFTSGGNVPQDEATQFAIRAVGGLRAIGHHPTDKLEWMQRRFVEAYETAADRRAPMLGHDDRPRLEHHGDWRDLA